jgi:serine/threonine protein kinase
LTELREPLPAGKEILGYTIKRVIGTGGFSIVYEGFNELTKRRGAIKEFLPAQLASRSTSTQVLVDERNQDHFDKMLEKFSAEIINLSELSHENIVRVRDGGMQDGLAYMVMDYVEGPTLNDWAKDNAKSITEDSLWKILEPLLGAIEHLHEKNLLHRDITPKNVLVQPDGLPKLIDFGTLKGTLADHYAATQVSDGSLRDSQARSSIVVVTPAYAPPEQLSATGDVGRYSDVYALGAVLHEVVTGKPPLAALDRMMAKSQTGNDPYVSVAQQATRFPLSESMTLAIDSALNLTQSKRPQSVSDLRKVMRGEGRPPDSAHDPGDAEGVKVDKSGKKLGWAKAVAAVMVLGVIGGGIVMADNPDLVNTLLRSDNQPITKDRQQTQITAAGLTLRGIGRTERENWSIPTTVEGVLVTDVASDANSMRSANVTAGDVITGLGGTRYSDPGLVGRRLSAARSVGGSVSLNIWRDNVDLTAAVSFETAPGFCEDEDELTRSVQTSIAAIDDYLERCGANGAFAQQARQAREQMRAEQRAEAERKEQEAFCSDRGNLQSALKRGRSSLRNFVESCETIGPLANDARRMLNEATPQRHTIAGMTLSELSMSLRVMNNISESARGLYVHDVQSGSEASVATIVAGSIITRFAGSAIEDPASVERRIDAARQLRKGSLQIEWIPPGLGVPKRARLSVPNPLPELSYCEDPAELQQAVDLTSDLERYIRKCRLERPNPYYREARKEYCALRKHYQSAKGRGRSACEAYVSLCNSDEPYYQSAVECARPPKVAAPTPTRPAQPPDRIWSAEYYNTDFDQGDIWINGKPGFHAENFAACRAACSRHSGCQFFTFNFNTTKRNHPNCFLKNRLVNVKGFDGATSGVVYRGQRDDWRNRIGRPPSTITRVD